MKDEIDAINIKSHSDSRKLGPFVTENKLPLVWVNWSKDPNVNGNKRKPYFRNYPESRHTSKNKFYSIEEELNDKIKSSESETHKECRNKLQSYLTSLINEKQSVKWCFLDKTISDFTISGDLLSEVEVVETNYKYKTPYSFDYEFDIALLGRKISKERILLGAIEIEKTHKFGFLKMLISKTLGFPLISINIDGLELEDINDDWCNKSISETTNNSEDGLRRNYVYIHNSLYPVYTNIPSDIRKDKKHQFLVFCYKEKFDRVYDNIKTLRNLLNLSEEVLIQPVTINPNEQTSISASENEGSLAGHDWKKYNDERYLRITLSVPSGKNGLYISFSFISC